MKKDPAVMNRHVLGCGLQQRRAVSKGEADTIFEHGQNN